MKVPECFKMILNSESVKTCLFLRFKFPFLNMNRNGNYHPTFLKTVMDWSNGEEWEIPFGLYGLIRFTVY